MLKTKIDEIIEIALQSDKQRISFKELSKRTGIAITNLEHIARIFEKHNILKISYPLNPLAHTGFKIIKELPPSSDSFVPKGKVLETYEIKDAHEHWVGKTNIIETEKGETIYFLKKDNLSEYAKIYLEHIKEKIAFELPPEAPHMSDEEKKDLIYKKQCEAAEAKLSLAESDEQIIKTMCAKIRSEMYGFGEVDILITDDWLEEIAINTSKLPVAVYHRKYGWLKTNVNIENEEQIANYSSQVARRIGKQITILNPILDAYLLTGDRVNATRAPISVKGNTLTIRRFARSPWTIVHFLSDEFRSMSLEMAALLWQAVQYEMNVLVAGGTASGKTSMLNALSIFIQPHQRIISIEDTRELTFSSAHWNWVPMVTRLPNSEGFGEVKMLDLLVNALRMRPDRIIVGEIRRQRDAHVLFEAMYTGHSVYSTLHADTGIQVIKRLTEAPLNIPVSEIDAIDLVFVQYRDRRRNTRKTSELSEIVLTSGSANINKIYLWRTRRDDFECVNPPNKYIQTLNLHTGMTDREINADQKKKAEILNWLIKHKWNELEQISKIMREYYSDEASVYKAAEQNIRPGKVI